MKKIIALLSLLPVQAISHPGHGQMIADNGLAVYLLLPLIAGGLGLLAYHGFKRQKAFIQRKQ